MAAATAVDVPGTIALAAALATALLDARAENAALAPCARALAFPPPPLGALSPAYFLLLCDKAFSVLDNLTVAEGGARAARKAVLGQLKEAERGAEAWGKVYVAPPLPVSAERLVDRVGARVRVRGGAAGAGGGGAVGEVTADSAVDGRCTVRVGEEVLRVRPANLELA